MLSPKISRGLIRTGSLDLVENLTKKVKNHLSKDLRFLKRFATHLKISYGALVCRGTQFKNHWSRIRTQLPFSR